MIKDMTPREFLELRSGGRQLTLLDVREDWETKLAPVMDAILVRRVDHDEWIRESLFETVVEPLINAAAPQRFVF